jgi:transposase
MQQRNSHPDSFKKDAVRRLMARGSKTVEQLAEELGVSRSMLHRWRVQFESEVSSGAPQRSQGEREEVEQLRRRLRDLEAENSLLKKAAALFAKDVK